MERSRSWKKTRSKWQWWCWWLFWWEESVTNISNRSPTSQSCQHKTSQISFANIDIANSPIATGTSMLLAMSWWKYFRTLVTEYKTWWINWGYLWLQSSILSPISQFVVNRIVSIICHQHQFSPMGMNPSGWTLAKAIFKIPRLNSRIWSAGIFCFKIGFSRNSLFWKSKNLGIEPTYSQ